jgi:hypothetical protein
MPTNAETGIVTEDDKHYVYTNADLSTLGQVTHTNLTIKGSTLVRGLIDGKANGGIFGGGDESAVMGNTSVTIENTSTSGVSDVYGGGNNAEVTGNTNVIIGSPQQQQP